MKLRVVLSLGILFVAGYALAQQTSYKLRAEIPFDFIVRGEIMSAGEYLVLLPAANPGPMIIREKTTGKGSFVIQVPTSKKWTDHAQMSFHQVGEKYFLIEISDPRTGVYRVVQNERYMKEVEAERVRTVTIPIA